MTSQPDDETGFSVLFSLWAILAGQYRFARPAKRKKKGRGEESDRGRPEPGRALPPCRAVAELQPAAPSGGARISKLGIPV